MFRYYNMDVAIRSGMETAEKIIRKSPAVDAVDLDELVLARTRDASYEVRTCHTLLGPRRDLFLKNRKLADQLLAAGRHPFRGGHAPAGGGHEVMFINGAFLTHEQVLAEIRAFRPRFVGHLRDHLRLDKAKKTAADLKKRYRRDACFICRRRALSHRGPGALPGRCGRPTLTPSLRVKANLLSSNSSNGSSAGRDLDRRSGSRVPGRPNASLTIRRGRSSPISIPFPSLRGSFWAMRTAISPRRGPTGKSRSP